MGVIFLDSGQELGIVEGTVMICFQLTSDPLSQFSDPKPVWKLSVKVWTNSSITLSWEAPEGLNPQNCTYWVQWTGQGDKNGTQSTTDISFTVNGLDAGSLYEFFMWVKVE